MNDRLTNHPGELSTDARLISSLRTEGELGARAEALEALNQAGIPYLVGGAYAYANYTGIFRDTKDLDLFLRPRDALPTLEVLARAGWRTERLDEVWIYKAFKGEYFVDVIFNSGNGVAVVDDEWFTHPDRGEIMGHPVQFVPPEEMIWSKAYVLERERYDGADVAHLIRGVGKRLDWKHLLARFDRHWEVLLSQLLLFRFSYPSERDSVPDWLMIELCSRGLATVREGNWELFLCRGNLLSRVNYQLDISQWGYLDGRRWDEGERAKERGHGSSQLEDSRGRGG